MFKLRNIILKIQKIFLGFDTWEKKYQNNGNLPDNFNPIFVLGSPRSGTTLVFQQLITHSKLIYISNLMALFPNQMIKILTLTKKFLINFDKSQENHYGYIPGINSPNEAGAILRLWFEKSPSIKKKKSIINTVKAMTTISGRPLIIKNLNNAERLDNIIKVFPKARFIYVKRDPLMAAQSILIARKNLSKENEWFGIKPKDYDKIKEKSIHYQAVWQVLKVNKIIENFMGKNKDKFIFIDYESFCDQTINNLNQIITGFGLERKEKTYDSLKNRNVVSVSKEDWKKLKESYMEINHE